jgi:SAM-dependent methyltransferase|tara:strand:+ start:5343 stop:6014 length:672 start_codon:yes stop_codon:yes gene_type:complete
MKLFKYRDYDHYLEGQRLKQNFQDLWAKPDIINQLAQYIKENVPNPKAGLCHGVRRGEELEHFLNSFEDLGLNGMKMIGTDICDFSIEDDNGLPVHPDVIWPWDFHKIKDEWVDNFDFIYTNSLDHTINPEEILDQWMKCLKKDGICIIEWQDENSGGTGVNAGEGDCDCFGATVNELKELIETKYKVVEWLELKTEYKTYSKNGKQRPDDNMQHDHFIVKHK